MFEIQWEKKSFILPNNMFVTFKSIWKLFILCSQQRVHVRWSFLTSLMLRVWLMLLFVLFIVTCFSYNSLSILLSIGQLLTLVVNVTKKC